MQRLMAIWWRLVRFGFRLLYNELAFTYDLVSWIVSTGAWRCWQRSALAYLPQPHTGCVLELAHGTGNLQLDLKQAAYDSIGYDLSPYMGRIAHRKLIKHGFSPVLTQGMAQQLPFADDSFAAVVSTFPTDFIIAPATLREVQRVLKPDGVFIVVPSGVLTGGDVVVRFLEWLYRITGQREPEYESPDQIFTPYGFRVKTHEVTCPRSLATVIVAQKR